VVIVENCDSSGKYLEIQLAGGLGNQLFQLSHAITLSLETGAHLRLLPPIQGRTFNLNWLGFEPFSAYRASIDEGSLSLRQIIDCFCRISFRYSEPAFVSTPKLDWESGYQIHGYFQSENFFVNFKNEIKQFYLIKLRAASSYDFTAKEGINIHARFGDMARNKKARDFHGVIDDAYLVRALSILGYLTNDFNLNLVSDDIESVRREIPLTAQLAHRIFSSQNSLDDLRFLAESDRLIISNSTFSWWAAYLSNARVVAPRKWFAGSYESLQLSTFLYQRDWLVI
jgi:hypothetical protein